ncbi:hypothetical protein SP41_72 [Salmonella phage 41]|nr:hypothetical protein SP41_72 [Salmonella phage 41]
MTSFRWRVRAGTAVESNAVGARMPVIVSILVAVRSDVFHCQRSEVIRGKQSLKMGLSVYVTLSEPNFMLS